jgi:nitric oxide reductase large subunit
VVNRRGESRLGCLVGLLVLAVGAYFAVDFGEAYFHFYQFKDAMGQEARFATTKTDEQITTRLSALADSLQLPPGAELITIERGTSVITISSDYDEVIKLPLKKERVIHFHPMAASRL